MNLTIPEEFPISEKERQLIKAKYCIFIAWRNSNRPCSLSDCPLNCSEPHLKTEEDCLRLLVDWIMEAEI